MEIDTTKWSGEGEFTALLVEQLRGLDLISFIRVEDAPTGHAEASYNFISNEVFVAFAAGGRRGPLSRWLGRLTGSRASQEAATIADLERALAATAEVGVPDYADAGMLQYLRTERIVPPYQTRGYKLVELVRIYKVGTPRSA
jgi:hypothetical protein